MPALLGCLSCCCCCCSYLWERPQGWIARVRLMRPRAMRCSKSCSGSSGSVPQIAQWSTMIHDLWLIVPLILLPRSLSKYTNAKALIPSSQHFEQTLPWPLLKCTLVAKFICMAQHPKKAAWEWVRSSIYCLWALNQNKIESSNRFGRLNGCHLRLQREKSLEWSMGPAQFGDRLYLPWAQ